MPERRRYTTRTRAKAVGIAVVDGVTAAERVTGIPKQTIDYWLSKPEFGQLRTTARESVIADLWVGLQIGVHELTKGLAEDHPLHHKAAAFRELAERYALLSGDATSRTESRELHDLPDSAYVAAIAEASRLIGASSPDREAEKEPAG